MAPPPGWSPQDHAGCAMPRGPAGHFMPPAVARLPTPAKAPGPLPSERRSERRSAQLSERSMMNGFVDSEDFVDAGVESEAEFLTSRSLPPSQRPRPKGSRTKRER